MSWINKLGLGYEIVVDCEVDNYLRSLGLEVDGFKPKHLKSGSDLHNYVKYGQPCLNVKVDYVDSDLNTARLYVLSNAVYLELEDEYGQPLGMYYKLTRLTRNTVDTVLDDLLSVIK